MKFKEIPFAGQRRAIIENVQPQIQGGKFFAKRVVGETLRVTADIFTDGHDPVRGVLKYRKEGAKPWKEIPMVPLFNDAWEASFSPAAQGFFEYTLQAWVDYAYRWQDAVRKKSKDGQDVSVELQNGLEHLRYLLKKAGKKDAEWLTNLIEKIEQGGAGKKLVESVCSKRLEDLILKFPEKQFATDYSKILRLWVDRPKALFSAWYELFPRSAAAEENQHGTFKDLERLLPRISDLGFDVLYLPPIHPIGEVNRKGKNNSTQAQKGEPGSPWAIGSRHGGHKAIHPKLGTEKDYIRLIEQAQKHGLELAMDFALQCAPDHPYVKEHPQWFKWQSDGTVKYAENPPKKYQDILPFYFETEDWQNLWRELLDIALYWVKAGVRIFRVDNPHTKPFVFWEWLIDQIHREYPDVIFLSEAFTRPKVMHELAKAGFTHSYTYFTWRNSKAELEEYIREISGFGLHYFRPNFWPNTPDINPYNLQSGNQAQFMLRYFLAATLSSNYGVYAPVYEKLEHAAVPGKEEYLNSEKYEIRHWDWEEETVMTQLFRQVNTIRRDSPALQQTGNIQLCFVENEHLLAYLKFDEERSQFLLMVVNLDVYNTQHGWVQIPMEHFEDSSWPLEMHDRITGSSYHWNEEWNYVELHPGLPFHLFEINREV